MLSRVRDFLVQNMPWLGIAKRFLWALRDALGPLKKTYAQTGEDAMILKILNDHNVLPGRAIYVDVGANHPTTISNTYLFYRLGYTGILVEPNIELASLLRWFRRKDVVLNVAASNDSCLVPFYVSRAPVRSSTVRTSPSEVWKTYYVPALRIDQCLDAICGEDLQIGLLSIDVEGINYQVLEGCAGILERTLVACIEFDVDEDKERYRGFLHGFDEIQTLGCNALFINKKLKACLLSCRDGSGSSNSLDATV